MTSPEPTVRFWPCPLPPARLTVIAVGTPRHAPRAQVRQQVRQVLCQALAALLACPAESVQLHSTPGQAIRLTGPDPQRNIGLSLSHDEGLSLLAIHLDGPVGVDLVNYAQLPTGDEELARLADDYLGNSTAPALANLPLAERRAAFAQAWADLEARLKCRGLALGEAGPEQAKALAGCRSFALTLPDGFSGAVAVAARV